MKKKKSYTGYIILILIAVIFISVIFTIKRASNTPGEYDLFAQCIAESGTKMYGTWWCRFCAEQKKLFGPSWKIIVREGAYVECANADKSTTQECLQAGILSYPTWKFADGSVQTGKLDFFALSQKTGCELK